MQFKKPTHLIAILIIFAIGFFAVPDVFGEKVPTVLILDPLPDTVYAWSPNQHEFSGSLMSADGMAIPGATVELCWTVEFDIPEYEHLPSILTCHQTMLTDDNGRFSSLNGWVPSLSWRANRKSPS